MQTISHLTFQFVPPAPLAIIPAEPDREYLVRFRNDSAIRVMALINVDGAYLGYDSIIGPNATSDDSGLWNVRGGVENFTALKFTLLPVRAGASSTEGQANSPHFGKVTVSFYETLEGTQVELKDQDGTETFRSASATASGDISSSITSSSDKKKAFKTDAGMHETDGTMLNSTVTKYEKGSHLGDVTIHYCSVLGLIHKGILPSTPASSQQHTPTDDSRAPKKKGSSAINTSDGRTRLDFEEERKDEKGLLEEEEDGDFVEVVVSSSEPVQKKAKTADQDAVIDLCESDAE